MERAADSQGLNIADAIKPTHEEQEHIYGLSMEEFQGSGLSLDIQAVSILQARLALDILLADAPRRPAPVLANWLIHYNRPLVSVPESRHFKTIKLRVKPHKECQCAERATSD